MVTTTESFINRYVNHYLVINMKEKARKVIKNLKEKDKELVEEIKRIKKLQKGLYREYEIEEDTLED